MRREPLNDTNMIQSKLPDVGTTIFTTMSQLAVETGSINLGQGFPDFDPDPALCQKVTEAMALGLNQYPPMPGLPALRAAISAKVAALYGHTYDAGTEITVTSGATQALMAAIFCSAGAGDEVIVIEPGYDSYRPAIRLAGATPVAVAMRAPTDSDPYFRFDWDAVREAITPRTRLLIINSPHNPTATVLEAGDLDALEALVSQHGLLILSDEVYEHILFDERPHLSMATRPALAARSFIVSSFGKTYHTTGWKLGYCLAPAALMQEFRKVHQFMVFTSPTPMQHAYADFVGRPETYSGLSAFYQEKRDFLAQGLAQTRFRPLPSAGTFFLLAQYDQVSDLNESDFSIWLTREHGVTVIPVAAFYQNPQAPASNHGIVRFCFAKKTPTLAQALERLQDV
ncbi:methionine aminotransferase [Kerstersia gyiorum]|uniref:Methionine aminotransferase n=2 Tax=Kerstersia gyiorum TaxID=206506 RepID=A0A4Q7MVI3_9BURK|nr:methionine aminotransferase [Kerstersia gyiorum]